jgi:flagellar basal-body rod protein FlgC
MALSEVNGIASSAMQANRLWIDIIANNVANANTTRTANGDPYRRQMPIFAQLVDKQMAMQSTSFPGDDGEMGEVPVSFGKGVQATAIVGDQTPFKITYNPGHPDADARGFVRLPNISVITEMVDMLAAQRNYDASVQLVNSVKTMTQKALEIGR